MTIYAIKVLISAVIIVAVAEVSKRNSFLGGLLASLPLVSFLGILWLYHDTKKTEQVAALSTSIFWLVLPSLVFFLVLPMLLKAKWRFYPSFGLATLAMLASYGALIAFLKMLGWKL